MSGAAGLAIDLSHVSKTYRGRVRALRGIEMRVHRGEVFGLLGPNGAGKSTLVKVLMTVIRPTKCAGTVLGESVGHKATLARVGYLPEHHRFPEYLTGAQVLDFYGAMALVPRRERRARAAQLLDLVGMTAWAGKRVRSYSKGMRQRIGVAQALVNDPDLVLLDEPTDGVDPVGRRDIRNVLTHIKERGKTVFVNSHLLSELELVCDRVAILVQGLVSAQGTIDELTRGQQRYEIEIGDASGTQPADAAALLGGVVVGAAQTGVSPAGHGGGGASRGGAEVETQVVLGEGNGSLRVGVRGGMVRIAGTDPLVIQPVIDLVRARGGVIRSVRAHRPSLEDLFMQAVTDPTTGETLAPGASGPGRSERKGKRA